ncbi:hypothetical protein AVKW3434_22020 [Acidovorax sp. SUPP3434]|uniref:hypothetical protein n=1 Tax=Acidovorax sp. SUPP3434 TaxID=2920880 RepID=UPI0023DE4FFD|nr:hypothetical protein [Acidovorax sp. SUPP3434]GKT02115.1 hypothetical protein AVKW3434_22020 [Acidovorax sp. SUPP3434]
MNAERTLIVDRGCPSAALLPLTNNLDEINLRLSEMSRRHNINYSIAMGWAAMALAPNFRGDSGWGLGDDLPKEFDEGTGSRVKAIVFLVNTSDTLWFDNDAYNRYVGESTDGCVASGTGSGCSNYDGIIAERIARLCRSFREKNLKFHLIVTGNDEAVSASDGTKIASATKFRQIAGSSMEICTEGTNQLYLSGADFVDSEEDIQHRLEEIAKSLHNASSYVKLVE